MITPPADPAGGTASAAAPLSSDRVFVETVRRLRREARAAMGIAALACALTLLAGLEAQREIQEARSDVQKQVAELDATSRQARALAEQSQASAHDLDARLGALESRISDTQGQQVALEALYRDLSINQEDGALAEVEQAVAIANQELLLAGDVRQAIRAMENASRRLERIDRPSLLSLRRIIDLDLRRLRAVPVIDVAGASLRLDNFAAAADTLPLAAFARPTTPARVATAPPRSFWGNLSERLVGELGQAVRIQRTDGPVQAPLVPEQAFFLRQTLKLRLLTARQALLARDETTYRSDLRTSARWVDAYFDRQDRAVQKIAENIRQMADSPMSISLPGVEASLAAVRDTRATRSTLQK
jgi:uroporphyrin-3 C-methyltransferase